MYSTRRVEDLLRTNQTDLNFHRIETMEATTEEEVEVGMI